MGNGTYLYGGPMEYDFVPNKLYVNKVNAINKLADIEKLSQNNAPRLTLPIISLTRIHNYELIENLTDLNRSDNSGNEYNKDGTCGYLAAAIILYHAKYQFNNNFVDDSLIETYNGKRRFKVDLHDELVHIGKKLGKNNDTIASDICDVMKEYCKEKGISANHFWRYLSSAINIDACIRDNKPVALFGNFTDPHTNKRANHVVTCYGTYTEAYAANSSIRYLVVHFGWSSTKENNYSSVYLLDNLFLNPIGSMYNMNY